LQPSVNRRQPSQIRCFLLHLSEDMAVQAADQVLIPAEATEAGFADPRLFAWREALWCCARVAKVATDGEPGHVLARLDSCGATANRLTLSCMLHNQGQDQRLWIPQVKPAPADDEAEGLRFITGCDPTRVVDEHARPMLETTPPIAAEQFDGGTPAIDFEAYPGQGTGHGWLTLIHEAEMLDGEQYDRHRWVLFDDASVLRAVSPPFVFGRDGIERAAGLAPHPDGRRLVISYGVGEDEAWLATVDTGDIRGVLEDAERLSRG
jgi:hypothetical protein